MICLRHAVIVIFSSGSKDGGNNSGRWKAATISVNEKCLVRERKLDVCRAHFHRPTNVNATGKLA